MPMIAEVAAHSVILIIATTGGGQRVSAQGRLRLPAALRHRCGLRARDRLLLVPRLCLTATDLLRRASGPELLGCHAEPCKEQPPPLLVHPAARGCVADRTRTGIRCGITQAMVSTASRE